MWPGQQSTRDLVETYVTLDTSLVEILKVQDAANYRSMYKDSKPHFCDILPAELLLRLHVSD